jgi:hypothetical protein
VASAAGAPIVMTATDLESGGAVGDRFFGP